MHAKTPCQFSSACKLSFAKQIIDINLVAKYNHGKCVGRWPNLLILKYNSIISGKCGEVGLTKHQQWIPLIVPCNKMGPADSLKFGFQDMNQRAMIIRSLTVCQIGNYSLYRTMANLMFSKFCMVLSCSFVCFCPVVQQILIYI